MATFGDELYQSTRRKMNAQARAAMQTAAGDEQIEMIGVSSDGKQAVVLGSQRLISRDDERALHELDLANLQSVVAMENRNAASGRSADYVLAALVPGETRCIGRPRPRSSIPTFVITSCRSSEIDRSARSGRLMYKRG